MAFTDEDYRAQVRDDLVCGECASSTVMVWRKENNTHSRPPRDCSVRRMVSDEDDVVHVYFIVRCAFFKMNVSQPKDIVYCEGFKTAKET